MDRMKDKEIHQKGAVERIFRERNQSELCPKTIPQFVRIANAIISVQYIIGLNFGENGDAVITLLPRFSRALDAESRGGCGASRRIGAAHIKPHRRGRIRQSESRAGADAETRADSGGSLSGFCIADIFGRPPRKVPARSAARRPRGDPSRYFANP